jgi:hypothetical protein
MATVFEPISPVPPMTTIFMVYPPLSMTGDPKWVRCRCGKYSCLLAEQAHNSLDCLFIADAS